MVLNQPVLSFLHHGRHETRFADKYVVYELQVPLCWSVKVRSYGQSAEGLNPPCIRITKPVENMKLALLLLINLFFAFLYSLLLLSVSSV